MPAQSVLVVEDDEQICELLRYNLAREGYQVRTTAGGREALRAIGDQAPELVVLDLMLPDLDGLEVCRRLKRDPATQDIPVVMVTARGEEADVVTGLEMGADDYVTKPFSPRVLLARIRAVLRRRAAEPTGEEDVLRVHNVTVDPRRHEVLVDDEPVPLTATEFRVLHVLARRPGWVFTRRQIAGAVHGCDDVVTDRAVDVQIVGLRKKLGEAGQHIETVRGVGYRMKE
jgi:two-component system alkaline phosphatase synthesis response regulator PhoP